MRMLIYAGPEDLMDFIPTCWRILLVVGLVAAAVIVVWFVTFPKLGHKRLTIALVLVLSAIVMWFATRKYFFLAMCGGEDDAVAMRAMEHLSALADDRFLIQELGRREVTNNSKFYICLLLAERSHANPEILQQIRNIQIPGPAVCFTRKDLERIGGLVGYPAAAEQLVSKIQAHEPIDRGPDPMYYHRWE